MIPTALCTLSEVKDILNIPGNETSHDAKLQFAINGIQPVVETIVGPVVPRVFDEKYSPTGSDIISLRHRPNAGPGTSPLLDLIAVTEYQGQIPHVLLSVANPAVGSLYSVEVNAELGTLTRRTSGGSRPWAVGRNAVHVVYRAGQSIVPANVQQGTLELIRVNYQHTQQAGRSRAQMFDDEGPGTMSMGYFMPNRVKEMLQPNRRGPSIA